jgi:WD40 repeat protein
MSRVLMLLVLTAAVRGAPVPVPTQAPPGPEPSGPLSLRHEGRVYAAVYSPDGRTLFTAGDDREVREWDLADGSVRRRFRGHRIGVTALAVSPDGQMLASGDRYGGLRLWDLKTDRCFARMQPEGVRAVVSLSLSADGRLMAAFTGATGYGRDRFGVPVIT